VYRYFLEIMPAGWVKCKLMLIVVKCRVISIANSNGSENGSENDSISDRSLFFSQFVRAVAVGSSCFMLAC